MFTGIIEQTGLVVHIEQEGTNKHFTIEAPFTHELKIDQSVAHNGVCLTVVNIEGNRYRVTAIDETLQKTTLSKAKVNDVVNLERCMQANGRFDGHIVQGHVDSMAKCTGVQDMDGSWLFTFRLLKPSDAKYIVDKGSICVNGISLTVVSCADDSFSVAIIPYTFEHTNLKNVFADTLVNLEYDIVGKYVAKMLASK